MADFNPELPSTPPASFVGYSRPIQSIQANQAGATLGRGIGNDIEEGAHLLNTVAKDNIEDDVQTGMQNIRDNYRNRLQATYNDVSGQPLDILPQDSQGNGVPPPDLAKTITDKLNTLQAARASGKYSDTHLDMEYDDFLKGKRAQYSGYKDWIDEVAAKSLGRGQPANREIAQLTGDINSYAALMQKQKNDVDTRIGAAAADGDPEAGAVYQHRNNIPDPEKTAFLNRKDTQSARLASMQQTRDQATDDPGLRTSAAFAEANQRVSDALSNFVHTFTMGGSTPEQLVSKVEDQNSTPEQKANSYSTLNAYMQIFRQRQIAQFNQVDPKTGRSLEQDLGGKGQDIIDGQTKFYSAFQNWMQNGTGGPLASTVGYMKAKDADPTGGSLTKYSADQYVGNVNNVVRDNPGGNTWLSNMVQNTNNINPTIKAAVDSHRVSIGGGQVTPVNQLIQQAKADNLPEKVGDANARGYFGSMVNWHQDLFNRDSPQVQHNMAQALYGPGNEGVLKNFPKDSATSSGQSTVYNQWFSPGVDKVMFNEIGRHDPQLLANYVERKKQEFGNTVFPGEIQTLNSLVSPDSKLSYDNDTHMFGIHGPTDVNTQRAINRVNTSLYAIRSLASHTHEDPNGLVLGWLSQSGIEDGPATKAINMAVKSSFLSAKKAGEDEPKRQFSQFP